MLHRGSAKFSELRHRELRKILLPRTRMNEGEAASHRRHLQPPNPQRYFGPTGKPYTLGGGYDTQADSLLPPRSAQALPSVLPPLRMAH
jgi:hypothetical protein